MLKSAAVPTVRRYNRRMARRIAHRAHLQEEAAVAVAFAFNNLTTMLIVGVTEDITRFIPIIGAYVELLLGVLAFYFHRIVLVTDQNVYVLRDRPFHFPGRVLMKRERGPGTVRLGSTGSGPFMRFIRRGQLTFADGTVVYHSFIFTRRARYIEQEANLLAG